MAISKDILLSCFRTMARIRAFETRLEALCATGRVPGTFHSSAGQEAVAAGVAAACRRDDLFVSNHRGHGHLIAKGGDPKKLAAELFGRTEGYARGRGGTQHVAAFDVGFMGAMGITGGGIPIATGIGLALAGSAAFDVAPPLEPHRSRTLRARDAKRCETGGPSSIAVVTSGASSSEAAPNDRRVVVCFLGDGASNQGTFHESLNMAALTGASVLYVCENNGWAMGTATRDAVAIEEIHLRAESYGLPHARADGNDVAAVFAAASEALDLVRAEARPYLLECVTYRVRGHSKSDGAEYRPAGELEDWVARDPLAAAERRLVDEFEVPEGELRRIADDAAAEVNEAVRFAEAAPPGTPELAREGVFATPVDRSSPDPSR